MNPILLAAHGGPSAEGAVRVAGLLETRLRTTLETVCVLEPLPVIDYGYVATLPPSQEQYQVLSDALRAAVTQQLRRCEQTGGTPQVAFGLAASEIARTAREKGALLIVTGIGPHHVLDRALGGETALQLVQLASTPVLAVPANATTLPRRVMAAIDFTPTSLRAARVPLLWLGAGDSLQLVHVAAEPDPTAAARLEELKADLQAGTKAAVETVPLRGDPARSLLGHAESSRSDLITAGTHGYGIWKRLTLGSVASKIVRLSPIAVLIAPLGSVAQGAG
ncbi:MAG TPA: universal stress protein [Gemmatimonadales bacterium]|nr:universal stress protein [Gemmatimonadales bacterium]